MNILKDALPSWYTKVHSDKSYPELYKPKDCPYSGGIYADCSDYSAEGYGYDGYQAPACTKCDAKADYGYGSSCDGSCGGDYTSPYCKCDYGKCGCEAKEYAAPAYKAPAYKAPVYTAPGRWNPWSSFVKPVATTQHNVGYSYGKGYGY